jgi:AcrR family transcriptional regulator
LIGMLSWANLSPNWSRGPTGNRFRGRLSAAMRELVRHGVAADGQPPFHCRADAGAFLPGPINAFDRREASEMKIDQLLAAASRRFNRNGIEATSLDEIAASLGATKGIFYHYLQDKADLVARSYERAYRLYEAFVDTAARSGASGLERTIIGCHLNVQAQAGVLSPLMPQPGLDALPEPLRADLIQRGRRLNLAFRNFLREGVADGSCRACDELIVAQIGAGTFGWLPKWLPPDDPPSPALLAEEICALVSHGLAPR